MQQIDLSLNRPNLNYQILIGSGLLAQPISVLEQQSFSKIAIISNELVANHYHAKLQETLTNYHGIKPDLFFIGDGESYKSQATFEQALDFLIDKEFKRNDNLVALGGGVVGDLTGFTAACYQRGINFIQIPTSLLAMVDSSVGGKTAINHAKGKNLIGAFHQPLSVIIDTDCLQTLDKRQFNAGMAEVIKIAALRDLSFFEWLEVNKELISKLSSTEIEQMIYRSCVLKSEVVAEDEQEQGVRALLNFGHTFGHAIENLAGYGTVLHGEAVAIGMILASKLSAQEYGFDSSLVARLESLLEFFELPTKLPNGIKAESMVHAMQLDKKNRNAQIRLILPIKIGQAQIKDYSTETIQHFLQSV